MYNGIGLQTPRGSGTNGYVQRNISSVRKTKEKVPDYQVKEDAAVRPFDPELVEHERRRQAEVRCMELRELLEEQDLAENEIEDKVNAFRCKLLAEKKLSYQRDSSGRALVKDSHDFSVAQEQKNDRAKDAFGIRQDFIPGSSLAGKKESGEMSDAVKEIVETDSVANKSIAPLEPIKSSEKAKKRKKSHKRSKRSSSSSPSSSSDEETQRKKRKKEKKKEKKSKKSHRHRRENESSSKSRKRSSEPECGKDGKLEKSEAPLLPPSPCCISVASSESESDHFTKDNLAEESEDEDAINSKYSLSVVDFSGNHKFYSSLPKISECNSSNSPVEAIKRACLPLLANVSDTRSPIMKRNGNHEIECNHHSRRRSGSSSSGSDSKYSSRSGSRSSKHSLSLSKSQSRSPTRSLSVSNSERHRSVSSTRSRRSKSSEKYHNKTRNQSNHSRSASRSRSRSHSASSSLSKSSHSISSVNSSSRSKSRSSSRSPKSNRSESRSPKSNRSRSPSIPRRRGSPSFMERRRITSARKRPIPYKRKDGIEWQVSSGSSDSED